MRIKLVRIYVSKNDSSIRILTDSIGASGISIEEANLDCCIYKIAFKKIMIIKVQKDILKLKNSTK